MESTYFTPVHGGIYIGIKYYPSFPLFSAQDWKMSAVSKCCVGKACCIGNYFILMPDQKKAILNGELMYTGEMIIDKMIKGKSTPL